MEIQEKVNRSICEGGPGYDESEVIEEYGEFLKTRSVDPIEWKRRHQFMKRSDDGPCLGVKWPALSSDSLDEEAYNEGAQVGDVSEPNDVSVADSCEKQDESAQPSLFQSVGELDSGDCIESMAVESNHGHVRRLNGSKRSVRVARTPFARFARSN